MISVMSANESFVLCCKMTKPTILRLHKYDIVWNDMAQRNTYYIADQCSDNINICSGALYSAYNNQLELLCLLDIFFMHWDIW